MKNSKTLVQLFRYGIVGGGAFIVDYGVLWTLTEYCYIHYLLSATISFLLGLSVNYMLSTAWVFAKGRCQNKLLEIIIFAIIGVVGLLLNEAIIYLIADVLLLHYMVGKVISTIVVFFWNFYARKYILFNE